MDRRQNLGDLPTALLAALDGRQAIVWTAMPATIVSFDPEQRTVAAQPTIQALANNPDGTQTWITMPQVLDCPVFFPGGRGLSLTFPLQAGDEVLIIFASRCIDAWWQRGGIQRQQELRMHDLSDGFCFPAILSQPAALARAPVSLDGAELRNAAGTTRVRVTNGGDVSVVTPGTASVQALTADVTAATINLTGNVVVVGSLTVNSRNFMTHQHSGVSTGVGQTGGVV